MDDKHFYITNQNHHLTWDFNISRTNWLLNRYKDYLNKAIADDGPDLGNYEWEDDEEE